MGRAAADLRTRGGLAITTNLWWTLDRLINRIELVQSRPVIEGVTESRPEHPATARLRKAQRALEFGVDPDLVRAVLSEPVVRTAITRTAQAMPLAWRHLPGT